MKDDVGDRALNRLTQIRMNFIDGFISSYWYIIKSPKRLEQIRQENKLVSALCDLESDLARENEYKRKILMED